MNRHTMCKLLACVGMLLGAGCAESQSTTRPSASDGSEAALRDPFGYSPSFDQHDISGGGISDFDGSAIKRDLNHVFNP